MKIVQLLVRTNIPELNGEMSEDGFSPSLWLDTSWSDLVKARAAYPLETYRQVKVVRK